jgi:hypothetical protein
MRRGVVLLFQLVSFLASTIQKAEAWTINGVCSPDKIRAFTKNAIVAAGIAVSVSFAPSTANAEPYWTGSYSGECFTTYNHSRFFIILVKRKELLGTMPSALI